MNRDEIIAGIEAKLRSLRSCDTQATAVAWMKDAYKLMEACASYLKDDELHARSSPIFIPERPRLQIVQEIPQSIAAPRNPRQWPGRTPTVVYPEAFLHPGLKVAPRAWTREDTLRLERAAKSKAPVVQRRGK